MSYPERLLPKRHFGYLQPKSIASGYLIRHTKSAISKDHNQNQRVKLVCEPREHILDLSCNLFGQFKIPDVKIEISKELKVKYFEDWRPLNPSLRPSEDEFTSINERGYYAIPVSDVHGHCVPVEGNNFDFKLKCKVVHRPTKCNYWHFELRWQDEEGNLVTRKDKCKRIASTSARAMIAQIMDTNINLDQDVKQYMCSLLISWTGFKIF